VSLVFGIGALAGMMLITAALAVPLLWPRRGFAWLNRKLAMGPVAGQAALARPSPLGVDGLLAPKWRSNPSRPKRGSRRTAATSAWRVRIQRPSGVRWTGS
jgi:hypothetical protein